MPEVRFGGYSNGIALAVAEQMRQSDMVEGFDVVSSDVLAPVVTAELDAELEGCGECKFMLVTDFAAEAALKQFGHLMPAVGGTALNGMR